VQNISDLVDVLRCSLHV